MAHCHAEKQFRGRPFRNTRVLERTCIGTARAEPLVALKTPPAKPHESPKEITQPPSQGSWQGAPAGSHSNAPVFGSVYLHTPLMTPAQSSSPISAKTWRANGMRRYTVDKNRSATPHQNRQGVDKQHTLQARQ